MRWSDYSNGERIKILRGRDVNQAALAEMTGLSIATIQKAEQDKQLSLNTLMQIADALGVDTSVILGQQAPRRAMAQSDRTMLRALSQAVHDTAAGMLPETAAGSDERALRVAIGKCWDLYWQGHYTKAGALVVPVLAEAAVHLDERPAGSQGTAWGLLADAYRLAAYVANLMGSRDLAYAAIGQAQAAAERSDDELRPALVRSGRAWVYLRDARLDDALRLAEKAAVDIEPRFSRATSDQLTVYGSHINFAAVVASRMQKKDLVKGFLSLATATGARLGAEHRAHGTLFGPVTADTQAVGIAVALGQAGKALELVRGIPENSLSALTEAARNRFAMDKAMAQADARLWDASLDTLEKALIQAPVWARHQALPSVIVQKVGRASTARVRRVSALIGVRPGVESGFARATAKAAP
ncbi:MULTISPECIES: helix-turn-helix domain-containing protein [Streptomyces]|uniref:helix-turn-helix domain-containing protein n=1 Tax=Streptomyces TaxID=1883 RepID=UPI00163BE868|nr:MULTISPECIES: helix-turn-helix transcriptional regulator [Streptomyces]MBC2877614.1 helix-turn-helix transcriptional regulator [Streptomyces sp. TYQ1024]UBI36152.1 helix-turn-helix domain-containing protein [Streptomyces mobaraensis]UKW28747.1 helix-turn-helix domain-containing protein [Streptomyces sp. TYQ1024]